jgi:hypothetical protein
MGLSGVVAGHGSVLVAASATQLSQGQHPRLEY